ncbi:MAG: dTMP kinase [Rhizobiales bacterium]|nr:dTMP kinase [Hyphomicrobiales bacterium]
MTRGRFIVLEGGEGVGKSTQARLLAAALHRRGIQAVLTREPGGTEGAEAIRKLLLDPPPDGKGSWNPRAEALLFAAARSDHVERLIRPALDEGRWVICDRFIDSSRAYQGGGSGLSDQDILDLHKIGSAGILPDKVLLLEVPHAIAQTRSSNRDGGISDAIAGRASDYHLRVEQAFKGFAEEDPGRFARIDAHGSPEEINARIISALTMLLDGG